MFLLLCFMFNINLTAKLQNWNQNSTFSWVSLIGFWTTWPRSYAFRLALGMKGTTSSWSWMKPPIRYTRQNRVNELEIQKSSIFQYYICPPTFYGDLRYISSVGVDTLNFRIIDILSIDREIWRNRHWGTDKLSIYWHIQGCLHLSITTT